MLETHVGKPTWENPRGETHVGKLGAWLYKVNAPIMPHWLFQGALANVQRNMAMYVLTPLVEDCQSEGGTDTGGPKTIGMIIPMKPASDTQDDTTSDTQNVTTSDMQDDTVSVTQDDTVSDTQNVTVSEMKKAKASNLGNFSGTENITASGTKSVTANDTSAERSAESGTDTEDSDSDDEMETDSESDAEAEPETLAATARETGAESKRDGATSTDTNSETETERDDATTTDTESESETETEPERDGATTTEAESGTETETDMASTTDTDSESETETEAERDGATTTEADTDSNRGSDSDSSNETDSDSETEMETEAKMKTLGRPVSSTSESTTRGADSETETTASETETESDGEDEQLMVPCNGKRLSTVMELPTPSPVDLTTPSSRNGTPVISPRTKPACLPDYDVPCKTPLLQLLISDQEEEFDPVKQTNPDAVTRTSEIKDSEKENNSGQKVDEPDHEELLPVVVVEEGNKSLPCDSDPNKQSTIKERVDDGRTTPNEKPDIIDTKIKIDKAPSLIKTSQGLDRGEDTMKTEIKASGPVGKEMTDVPPEKRLITTTEMPMPKHKLEISSKNTETRSDSPNHSEKTNDCRPHEPNVNKDVEVSISYDISSSENEQKSIRPHEINQTSSAEVDISVETATDSNHAKFVGGQSAKETDSSTTDCPSCNEAEVIINDQPKSESEQEKVNAMTGDQTVPKMINVEDNSNVEPDPFTVNGRTSALIEGLESNCENESLPRGTSAQLEQKHDDNSPIMSAGPKTTSNNTVTVSANELREFVSPRTEPTPTEKIPDNQLKADCAPTDERSSQVQSAIAIDAIANVPTTGDITDQSQPVNDHTPCEENPAKPEARRLPTKISSHPPTAADNQSEENIGDHPVQEDANNDCETKVTVNIKSISEQKECVDGAKPAETLTGEKLDVGQTEIQENIDLSDNMLPSLTIAASGCVDDSHSESKDNSAGGAEILTTTLQQPVNDGLDKGKHQTGLDRTDTMNGHAEKEETQYTGPDLRDNLPEANINTPTRSPSPDSSDDTSVLPSGTESRDSCGNPDSRKQSAKRHMSAEAAADACNRKEDKNPDSQLVPEAQRRSPDGKDAEAAIDPDGKEAKEKSGPSDTGFDHLTNDDTPTLAAGDKAACSTDEQSPKEPIGDGDEPDEEAASESSENQCGRNDDDNDKENQSPDGHKPHGVPPEVTIDSSTQATDNRPDSKTVSSSDETSTKQLVSVGDEVTSEFADKNVLECSEKQRELDDNDKQTGAGQKSDVVPPEVNSNENQENRDCQSSPDATTHSKNDTDINATSESDGKATDAATSLNEPDQEANSESSTRTADKSPDSKVANSNNERSTKELVRDGDELKHDPKGEEANQNNDKVCNPNNGKVCNPNNGSPSEMENPENVASEANGFAAQAKPAEDNMSDEREAKHLLASENHIGEFALQNQKPGYATKPPANTSKEIMDKSGNSRTGGLGSPESVTQPDCGLKEYSTAGL